MTSDNEITPHERIRLRTLTHKLIYKHLEATENMINDFPQYGLVLIVTALEETYKLKKLSDNNPMSENEWKDLIMGNGIHQKKITGIFREAQETLQNMGQEYDEAMHNLGHKEISIKEIQENIKEGGEDFLNALENLHYMKLDALYAGWSFKRKDVKSLTENVDFEDLKLLAGYLCDRVSALVIGFDLKYQYFVGGKFVDPRSALDPLFIELCTMRARFHTLEYRQKTAKVISILKQYPVG